MRSGGGGGGGRHHPTAAAAAAAAAAPGCGKRNIINHSPPDSKITETNECCCYRGERERERWKGKMRKNFTSSPILHITRKSQKSMQKRTNVGFVSGAMRAAGGSHEYFRGPFFLRSAATQTAMHVSCLPTGRRGRHSVAPGSRECLEAGITSGAAI